MTTKLDEIRNELAEKHSKSVYGLDSIVSAEWYCSYKHGWDAAMERARWLVEALEWYATPGIHERWKAEEALEKFRGEE